MIRTMSLEEDSQAIVIEVDLAVTEEVEDHHTAACVEVVAVLQVA
jgi:hypothetical protein